MLKCYFSECWLRRKIIEWIMRCSQPLEKSNTSSFFTFLAYFISDSIALNYLCQFLYYFISIIYFLFFSSPEILNSRYRKGRWSWRKCHPGWRQKSSKMENNVGEIRYNFKNESTESGRISKSVQTSKAVVIAVLYLGENSLK